MINVEASIKFFDDFLGVMGWKERLHQRESIENICKYFEEGKKFIMFNSPTGSGKSIIEMAVANGSESAYVIVGNNSLEEQYLRDFDVANIHGRAHYKCGIVDADCSEGLCQLKKNFNCEELCSYKAAKQECMDANVCLTNLMYFILEGGKSFKKRDLLILDDAHGLPETLIGFSRATISTRTANKEIGEDALELFNEHSDVRTVEGEGKRICDGENAVNYLKDIGDEVYNVLDCLDEEIELDDKGLKEYKRLRGLYGRLVNCREAGGAIISRHSTWNSDYSWIVVQPLLARKISEKLIFSRADKVLLSSATINRFMMQNELGFTELLGKGKSMYLPVPSTFPIDRRPLYLQPVCNFKYKNQSEENQDRMIMAIANIVHEHPGEKGIVFCQGYRYLKMLKGMSQKIGNMSEYDVDDEGSKREMLDLSNEIYRRMLFHEKDNRKEVLKKWMSTLDDSVLVGINMTEGLDLKGNMCRFSICFKAPFGDARDPRVAARLKLGHWNWYNSMAQQVLQQAYGRIMRSEDDYGSMYVLCEGAIKLLKRKGTSGYVKEAMIELNKDGSDKK